LSDLSILKSDKRVNEKNFNINCSFDHSCVCGRCSLSGGTGTGQAGNDNSSKAMKVTVVKFRNRIWRKNLRKDPRGT